MFIFEGREFEGVNDDTDFGTGWFSFDNYCTNLAISPRDYREENFTKAHVDIEDLNNIVRFIFFDDYGNESVVEIGKEHSEFIEKQIKSIEDNNLL